MIDVTLAARLAGQDARDRREADRALGELRARVRRLRWWRR